MRAKFRSLDGLAANHRSTRNYAIFWGLVRTPEDERDMSVIEANRLKMIDVMKILDNNLSDKTFVAGTSFSIGDIPLGIMVYRWLTLIKIAPQ